MKQTTELVLQRFSALIEQGKEVLRHCETSLTGEPRPRNDEYFSFRTQALSLVRRSCGENSDHYRELQRIATDDQSANNSIFFPHCLGVVEAACSDLDAGLLFDLRSEIAVEFLEGLLGQAERLLTSDRKNPAASLAGAALEAMLRRLYEAQQQTSPEESSDASSLNDSLANAGAYNRHVQSRIASLIELREKVDDGAVDSVTAEDVRDMVDWGRKFAADYLS